MTNSEKHLKKCLEMLKLRQGGFSYSKIGQKFKLTHQAVQFALKTHFPNIVKITSRKPVEKVCPNCEVRFRRAYSLTLDRKRNFCSKKCFEEFRYKTPEQHKLYQRLYQVNYKKTLNGQLAFKKAKLKYDSKNKHKLYARHRVYKKVLEGILIRPKVCSICSQRKRIEAHHPDYAQPLKVVWLCKDCHASLHHRIYAKI